MKKCPHCILVWPNLVWPRACPLLQATSGGKWVQNHAWLGTSPGNLSALPCHLLPLPVHGYSVLGGDTPTSIPARETIHPGFSVTFSFLPFAFYFCKSSKYLNISTSSGSSQSRFGEGVQDPCHRAYTRWVHLTGAGWPPSRVCSHPAVVVGCFLCHAICWPTHPWRAPAC